MANYDWKKQTHNLEEDFVADIDSLEDEVDGCILMPKMIPRNCFMTRNISQECPKPFFPVGGTKLEFPTESNSDKFCSVFEKCDSGLDSIANEDINDSLNCDVVDEQDRVSSIGDVDSILGNLTIKPSYTLLKELEQPRCTSLDEAYASGEALKSLEAEEEIKNIFCEQDFEGDSQAHLLLIHGKVNLFLQALFLVQTAAILNIQNNLHQSLLHLAVILHLPQVVRKLVARGADIDIRDKQGNTPLHLACHKADLECVLSLTTPLEPREMKDVPYTYSYRRIPQDQDIMNYEGLTCLHIAAERQDIKIVNHLLTKCNADINAQEGRGGETVLHQAVENNHQELVRYLLLHRDLHLEATRYDGSSALLLSQGRNNKDMVNLLINAGALDSGYNSCDMDSSVQDDCEETMDKEESNHEVNSDFTYDDFHIDGSLVT